MSRLLSALALIALVPAAVYLFTVASDGRAHVSPDAAASYAYVPTLWSAAAAVAIATTLTAFIAAARPSGWEVSAACVAAAAFLFGIASSINPEVPGSLGRAWGAAAILWSVVWSAAVAYEWRRSHDVVNGSDGTRTRDLRRDS